MKVGRALGVLPMKLFCFTREDPETQWSNSSVYRVGTQTPTCPLIWEMWSMTGCSKRITIHPFAQFLWRWTEDPRMWLPLASDVCLKWFSFWIRHWPEWASHSRGKPWRQGSWGLVSALCLWGDPVQILRSLDHMLLNCKIGDNNDSDSIYTSWRVNAKIYLKLPDQHGTYIQIYTYLSHSKKLV